MVGGAHLPLRGCGDRAEWGLRVGLGGVSEPAGQRHHAPRAAGQPDPGSYPLVYGGTPTEFFKKDDTKRKISDLSYGEKGELAAGWSWYLRTGIFLRPGACKL